MQLGNKWALWLLFLPPLLFYWQRFLDRHGERFVWFSAQAFFPQRGRRWKFVLVGLLGPVKMLALLSLLVALARPQLRYRYQIEESRGIDILLTLDTSGTMSSLDFKPKNRLEVAKDVIGGFISQRQWDRIGLVIYAATAFTKCPLTIDYEILKTVLINVSVGELEDGTAIGIALATSANRIIHSKAKTKIIILLTDGNNNRGEIDPRDAARMARDYGIKVYTIGVGTQGEAPFPFTDSFGRQQYVMVPVEIDEALLKDIASITGGLYFRATEKDSLQRIFSDIDRWEKSRIAFRTYFETTELFPLFLAFGLFLLLAVESSRRTFLRTLP